MQKARRTKQQELFCMECRDVFSQELPRQKFIHGPIGQLKWPLKVSGTEEALTCPDCGSRKLRKKGSGGKSRRRRIRVIRIHGGGQSL